MIKTMTIVRPAVRLALVTDDGRTVWARPLLDVTYLVVGTWVVLSLLTGMLDLAGAVLQWAGAYSALLFALLSVLLAALLWGLVPRRPARPPKRGGRRPGG